MSVHRIMGLETEYGILAPAAPEASPMVASGLVVAGYGASVRTGPRRPGWDYHDENPLADARGFSVARENADPSQLTDDPDDVTTANVVLSNGARLYVDHAHPEYSSPEVTNPLDAVRYDVAGEHIMRRGAQIASSGEFGTLAVYKNNTDNKGASYGTHENYLMPRSCPFGRIVRGLLPFFATRLLYTGNGRVGLGQHGTTPGFQISQRADFMEVEVGLETTLKRPLVNTRDEPHADAEQWRRLHVIVGDATRSQYATYLKMAATALVLRLIETDRAPELEFANPVAALHTFSRDVSCTATAELADGRAVSALDVQWQYYEAAEKMVTELAEEDKGEQTAHALDLWHEMLATLGTDPMRCASKLDWVAKYRLIQGMAQRDGLAPDHPRLELVDIQFADMTPGKGLAERLVSKGQLEVLVEPAGCEAAVTEPPADTRAYFRGQCVSRYARNIAAASWDSVVFDLPDSSHLVRVPMMNPYRGTRATTAALFEQAGSAAELVAAVTGR